MGNSDPDTIRDMIDLPGLPAVWLSSSKGETGLAVFQQDTGQPYLTLSDKDGDGVFDLLVYYSLSHDGEVLSVVEDYGMDGQPDLIVNVKSRSTAVFYEGAWRGVNLIGPDRAEATVVVDGEERLLVELLDEIGRNEVMHDPDCKKDPKKKD